MENSADDFLGRNQRDDVRQIMHRYSDNIDKVVRFGADLIEWDLTRDGIEKKDGYLVPILFLRNLIENIDAISILVRQGASDPAKALMRTVIENFFSLEYLLAEKQDERCLCFHVWNTYHNYKYYEMLDGSSDRAKQLQVLFKKDKSLQGSSPLILEIVEKLKANAKDLLALPLYRDFAREFERTKAKLKKNNPHWYSLYDGPQNVEGLANKSRYPALYEIYRGFSNTVHGVNIIQRKIAAMGDGQVGIEQLRFPREAQSMTQYAHNLCAAIYSTYVEIRLPERKEEFQAWLASLQVFRNELANGNPINFK
jgi:hypothetical protein